MKERGSCGIFRTNIGLLDTRAYLKCGVEFPNVQVHVVALQELQIVDYMVSSNQP